MFIVQNRKIFFAITGLLLAIAIGAVSFFGLPLSIDFKGGSIIEVTYTTERPDIAVVKNEIAQLALGEISVRESGTKGIALRTRTLTPQEHEQALMLLGDKGKRSFVEDRFNSVGPSLGSELGTKALYAIIAVITSIMLYIAWAFRRVSKPVSSWIYGFIVVIILVHDIIIPTGFYAVLSHFTGSQVDSLFVVALLAILGYSVNDTIVIFDRVREHLHSNEESKKVQAFDSVVGSAITETLGRSINTSLTVVLALLALTFLGSKETIDFALVLLVGVIAGTYSSILLAAPLLVPLAQKFSRVEVSTKKKK
jgi:preprotein translocase subunit SecF